MSAMQNVTMTIAHLLFPVHLSILYPWTATPVSITSLQFAAGAAGAVGIVCLALMLRRRLPLATAGIGFFLAMLLPSTFNLYKIGTVYLTSDRYGYVANIGVLMAVGSVLTAWATTERRRRWTCTMGVVFLAIFSVLSAAQIQSWRNEVTFFTSVTKRFPHSYIAHNNLGNALVHVDGGTGALIRALAEFAEAERLKPDLPRIQLNIASTLRLLHRNAEAEALFTKTVQANPTDAEAWFRLGNYYANKKEKEKAMEAYKKSMALDASYILRAYEEIGGEGEKL
jgi:phytoene dehydrogenase-like protein